MGTQGHPAWDRGELGVVLAMDMDLRKVLNISGALEVDWVGTWTV